MNKTVRNERRKLTGSWFNALATALMAAGVFALRRRKSMVLGRIAPIKHWRLPVPPVALR
jgi:hypothetical protein